MQIASIITSITGIIAFIWAVYKYLDTRKREQNLKEFENYHKLIKELVQHEDMEKEYMFVDRQTAIIYELRHFKRYYPFSYRTIISLKEKWEKVPNQFPRLLDECDRTIAYFKNKI
ncbi:MAG: hypothetical protein JST87_13745 [Bacteroidetes bacterium]|nr:hypothetical protein [Bacteroidota bacterium]